MVAYAPPCVCSMPHNKDSTPLPGQLCSLAGDLRPLRPDYHKSLFAQ